MPRVARAKSETGIYHIILRGINRQSIFEEAVDKERFIETIAYYKEKCEYRVFGYCLMDNHVHLLIKEEKEDISQSMKRISSSYVYWYNRKYERCGHLFQERFKSESVCSDAYLLTVLRYIHQNPVKAQIASDISTYKWSSYKEYIMEKKIVDTDYIMSLFSNKPEGAQQLFEKHAKEQNDDTCLEIAEKKSVISDDMLRQIIRQQYKIETVKFCDEARERQEQMLRELTKVDGITTRQIARVTGISPNRLWRL
ncbi:MAG: transposase [Desulfitibacter sp. BRH_c19]|nr:MAG: transposase [Desulfitibacter sp. BRH_c19]